MSVQQPLYSGHYRASWAFVVGINRYHHLSPLACAVKDASDVSACLINQAGFHRERVVVLLDDVATLDNILKVFDTTLSRRTIAPDDRIVIFFAGHGITRATSDGGKVGYIAPVDAQPRAWRTLLRMNDLVDQASFLPAKHILFIMDACYSGLSLLRASPSDPVMEHFMTHRAVQIITAGKDAEMVADGGDTENDNSVFTSYLLHALSGRAATATGLMTASDVMHYVYRQVVRTPRARQTPQFGWLEGDGDMVFSQSIMDNLSQDLEVSLRQGSVPARIGAVNALAQIASTDDASSARLALDRLEEVARDDPDPRVRYTALRVLGVETSPPTPIAAPTRPVRVTTANLKRRPEGSRTPIWVGIPVVLMIFCAASFLIGGIFALGRPLLQTDASGEFQGTAMDPNVSEGLLTEGPPGIQSPSPVRTATATRSYELSPPTVPPEGEIIFEDDFSSLDETWGSAPTNGLATRYIDETGEMFFGLYKPYELWVTQPSNMLAQDFVLSAIFTPREAQADAAYGLVFRQYDFDNYYYYRIGMDGTFALLLHDGGAVRQLVPPTSTGMTVRLNEPHRLTVEASGSAIALSLDGGVIATVNSPTLSYLNGTVGVAVETSANTPVSVTFDDFVLYRH